MTVLKYPDPVVPDSTTWDDPANIAQRFVAYWLADHGYTTNIDTKAPDSAEIEARGNTRSLLVHVRSAEQPNTPKSSSSDEESHFASLAKRMGFEPWEALVTLNEQRRPATQIEWRKLV